MSHGSNMSQVTFRAPREMAARVGKLADYHGRSASAELRLALAVHDARATLLYLNTPEGAAELGGALKRARAKVEANLTELEAQAYRPRPALPLETAK